MDKGNVWFALGIISPILFAWALAKIEVEFAGKAYAVYGGNSYPLSFLILGLLTITIMGDLDAQSLAPMMQECLIGETKKENKI